MPKSTLPKLKQPNVAAFYDFLAFMIDELGWTAALVREFNYTHAIRLMPLDGFRPCFCPINAVYVQLFELGENEDMPKSQDAEDLAKKMGLGSRRIINGADLQEPTSTRRRLLEICHLEDAAA